MSAGFVIGPLKSTMSTRPPTFVEPILKLSPLALLLFVLHFPISLLLLSTFLVYPSLLFLLLQLLSSLSFPVNKVATPSSHL